MRQLKIASAIRKEILNLFLSKFNDPRLKEIQIVDVNLPLDLSVATVSYCLVDAATLDVKQAQKLLKGITPRLRHFLGKQLVLRRVPRLEFVIDHQVLEQRNMILLLQKLPDYQNDSNG